MFTQEHADHANDILNFLKSERVIHNQYSWVGVERLRIGRDNHVTEDNLCNTTMCVAGASVFLKEGLEGINKALYSVTDDIFTFENKGTQNLGLTESQALVLFYETTEEEALAALEAISMRDKTSLNEILFSTD